jgi:hypothetical protein
LNIQIVNPATYAGWDDLITAAHPNAFFQTAGWARVLIESYGYAPMYFTIIENGQLAWIISLMEIKSLETFEF